MLRLVGYFVAVLIVMRVLSLVPIVGAIFHIPFLGFFAAAAVVSLLIRYGGEALLSRRRFVALKRQLGGVETPHNRGKLGSLLASEKRFAQAVPHLRAAVEGEPDSAEWHWRLGYCLLESGHVEEALPSLERAAEIDEEYGYGAVLLQLSEALRRSDQLDDALARLERFERNHGPNPESAYRRGRVLQQLDRKDEANAAFDEVSGLAKTAAQYQKKSMRSWVWKAFLARLSG